MMSAAGLIFSGPGWWWPALAFVVLGVFLLRSGYGSATLDPSLRRVCFSLKLIGIVALALCLLEPLGTGQRARKGANLFAVVADNGQGLQVKDRGADGTRARELQEMLSPNADGWQATLEESFQLRRYFFDTRLHRTSDFSEMQFDGRASAIGKVLAVLGDRFEGQPLAGVLLLTDGNATDLPEGDIDASGLPPVYPVIIGDDAAIQDVAVGKVTVSQTAFEDAPVTIQAEVFAGGYAGRRVTARLVDSEGRTAGTETRVARGNDASLSFRFQTRPPQQGVSFYEVRAAVGRLPEAAADEDVGPSPEATLENNTRVVAVDRGQGPYRILYVSGRPNWEFKFLNRALIEDEQIRLVGLVRIAKREPKFQFRGRVGESSNPLFRGFGDQLAEETERYDQPVLIRLNTRDATELAGGFPKTTEELFAYHALIIDDLEAEFFTQDQMTLIERFVSERGGGFLMLGGIGAFREGDYDRTPIGSLLPVYLDAQPDSAELDGLRLTLTREGWLAPWMRLRDQEGDERTRLNEMPPFRVMNRPRGVKPGASVLAEARAGDGRRHPALVAQRFGNGRVGTVLLGDLWRWGLRTAAQREDADKAWRQTARWLVADVPRRTELEVVASPDEPGRSFALRVRARDEEFLPLDNASVSLTVRPFLGQTPLPDGREVDAATADVRLHAEQSESEAGLYEAPYVARDSGGYLAEAVVTDMNGREVGRAKTGWTADPLAAEFRATRPNRSLLEAIARQTGGEVLSSGRLGVFAAELPSRSAPITETRTFPLWHHPLVFLLALACFVTEWGLRRSKGLA